MIHIPEKILKDFHIQYLYINHLLVQDIYSDIYALDYCSDNSGEYTEREVLSRKPSVAFLVVHKDKILMSRQFRAAVHNHCGNVNESFIYETVAGVIDDHDDHPTETIIRELEEETGIKIPYTRETKFTLVDEGFVSPGYTDEYQYLYILELDTFQEPSTTGLEAEGELIFSKWLNKDEINDIMKGTTDENGFNHKIRDMKTRRLVDYYLRA